MRACARELLRGARARARAPGQVAALDGVRRRLAQAVAPVVAVTQSEPALLAAAPLQALQQRCAVRQAQRLRAAAVRAQHACTVWGAHNNESDAFSAP
jgi:hypothetical protein